MNQENVRSSLVAAAIAIVVALGMGLIFKLGTSGTALFALAMAAIAFAGTIVISTVIARRHEGPAGRI